ALIDSAKERRIVIVVLDLTFNRNLGVQIAQVERVFGSIYRAISVCRTVGFTKNIVRGSYRRDFGRPLGVRSRRIVACPPAGCVGEKLCKSGSCTVKAYLPLNDHGCVVFVKTTVRNRVVTSIIAAIVTAY